MRNKDRLHLKILMMWILSITQWLKKRDHKKEILHMISVRKCKILTSLWSKSFRGILVLMIFFPDRSGNLLLKIICWSIPSKFQICNSNLYFLETFKFMNRHCKTSFSFKILSHQLTNVHLTWAPKNLNMSSKSKRQIS